MLSLALASLLQAGGQCAHAGGDPVVQPQTYVSPAGSCTFAVDPTQRDGRGSARCRLDSMGVEQWSRELPFTLQRVVVTDAGVIAGYSIDGGWDVWDRSVHIRMLEPNGAELLDESYGTFGLGYHPALPDVRQIVLQEELDRVLVRILRPGEDGSREYVQAYELSTGRPIAAARDLALGRGLDGAKWIIDVRAIHGAPLLLAQWYVSRAREPGSRFVLIDANDRVVWQRDSKIDPAHQESPFNPCFDSFVMRADRTREFEVLLPSDRTRVTFGIEPDVQSPSGWSVSEIARAPLADRAPAPEQELDELRLDPLAVVALSTMLKFSRPLHAEVDALGRILVEHSASQSVLVFDGDGRRLATCAPQADDMSWGRSLRSFETEDDGGLLLRFDLTQDVLRFDARGKRLGRSSPPPRRPHWESGFYPQTVGLIAPNDAIAVAVDRLPDRRWLERVAMIASSPDGSLAVLDAHDARFAQRGTAVLATYGPDGTPRREVECPELAHVGAMRFDGRRVLALANDSLVLIDTELGTRVRVLLVGADPRAFLPCFACGGRELWWIEREPLRLFRYALTE